LEDLVIETLENRRLLTASFDAGTGLLTVSGTASPDMIEFGSGTTTINVVITTNGQSTTSNFDATKVKRIFVSSFEGTDTVILGKVRAPATINGGKGNDRLSGGLAPDLILGGGGDDYMFGSEGNDTLDGQVGGDDMFGGAGPKDVVDYSRRTGNLTVGIGTLPDDGEAGEGDNVRTDVEVVFCGSGNDQVGTISGKPIVFYGNAGNDTLTGGSVQDFLDGGPGIDSIMGQGGDDVLHSRDGARDTVVGGGGTDTAVTDSTDVVTGVP